jgi:hypothetical protein
MIAFICKHTYSCLPEFYGGAFLKLIFKRGNISVRLAFFETVGTEVREVFRARENNRNMVLCFRKRTKPMHNPSAAYQRL